MRGGLRVLVLALVLGVTGAACSGDRGDAAGRASGSEDPGGKGAVATERPVGSGLGHQAFQRSTRLVVPAAAGMPLDRAARVLAGLSEGPLGTRLFVDQRPGEGGLTAWRDVADEEADGHQLAYVTEELLTSGGTSSGGVGPEDFEMAAQTDAGSAVLVAKGDPEVETLQWEDFEELEDLVGAAEEDPGLVEVADPRAGTGVRYRPGREVPRQQVARAGRPRLGRGGRPGAARRGGAGGRVGGGVAADRRVRRGARGGFPQGPHRPRARLRRKRAGRRGDRRPFRDADEGGGRAGPGVRRCL